MKPSHPDMNRKQLQDFIVARMGSMKQKEFAAKLGITPQFLNDILHGHRNPGPIVLKALGVEEIVLYRVRGRL